MQPSWNQIEAIIDYWAADDDETHPRLYANEWEDFLSASRKPSNIRCHLPPAAEDKGQAAARNTICSVAVGCMVMLRYCGAFCGGMLFLLGFVYHHLSRHSKVGYYLDVDILYPSNYLRE